MNENDLAEPEGWLCSQIGRNATDQTEGCMGIEPLVCQCYELPDMKVQFTHIMMTIINTAFTSVEMASRMNQVNSLVGVEPGEFITMVIIL